MKALWFFIFLVSCASGPEEIRDEGQSVIRSLVKELRRVKGREELMEHEVKISLLFKKLVTVVQKAETYIEKHPENEIPEFKWKDQDLSDELKAEINRLYRVEGCREILEKCENDALKEV